jgi:CheY-like chemotaxis protein
MDMAVPITRPAPARKKSFPSRRALRILYADDLHELRELAKVVLARDGHRVECVPDGRQALARLAADTAGFDLIITDHDMPDINGLELVSQLRALSFSGRILVFSSELNPKVRKAYQSLKVDGILRKPIPPSTLRKTIADLFAPADPTAARAG